MTAKIKVTMERSLSTKMVQMYLMVLNTVFVVLGVGLLIAGSWIAIDQNFLIHVKFLGAEQKDELVRLVAYAAIIIGGSIFLLAFSGCCGSIRESTCMLTTFCVTLVTLIVAECSAAILIYLFKSRVEILLIRSLQDQVLHKYAANNSMGTAWDAMQTELNCCGVLDFSDWFDSEWFHSQQHSAVSNQTSIQFVPWSCCNLPDVISTHDVTMGENVTSPFLSLEQSGCQEEAKTEIYRAQWLIKGGCFDSIMSWLKQQSAYFITAAVCVVVLQVLGTAAAIIHISKIKDKNLVVPISILPNSLC